MKMTCPKLTVKIVENDLFVREGRFWKFPKAPKPKIASYGCVQAVLPLYLTYPEFLQQAESSLVSSRLPDKNEALQVCWQIKVPRDDFLANAWMKCVFKTWAESLSPEFAFQAKSSNVRYWWCKVLSAKGGCGLWTYLVLAVDSGGMLLSYTFYSAGKIKNDRHYYLVRSRETRFEKEETYKSSEAFIANVRKISRRGENFICQEETREEYLQGVMNRNGTFYIEYQSYHMPWQMACDGCGMKEVFRLLRLFLKGGVPAIACELEWNLCEHHRRQLFDIGADLAKKLAKAEKTGRHEIAATIRAIGITPNQPNGQLMCPVFLDKRGKPVEWCTTLHYLPKNASRNLLTAIRICASLENDPFPFHMHELGMIFSTGHGAMRNYKLALFWERKALRHGSASARHEISWLRAMLDPERKRKSAKRRERLQSKIAAALRDFSKGKDNDETAYDRVYDILLDAEYDLHDGKMTRKDGNAVLRQCDCALSGIADGLMSAAPLTASGLLRPSRNRRTSILALCRNDNCKAHALKGGLE